MSEPEGSTHETARALRDAFDWSFAELPLEKQPTESLLAIRVGGDAYALRLAEVAGVHRDKVIVPAVSSLPELCGMAAFRAVIAPVYDLGALLGYPLLPRPRWLVLTQGTSPIALAFETFEAHLLVERALVSSEGSSRARPHIGGALSDGGGARAVIRIASIVEAILAKARAGGPVKER